MQADAVVLLGAGKMDVPPTWVRPGAAVIRCEPTLETGTVECIVIVITAFLHTLELYYKKMTLNLTLHSVRL